MGVWPSGTTFITFTDVKVPKTNIIGKEGDGFKQVMYNFNHGTAHENQLNHSITRPPVAIWAGVAFFS